MQSGQFGISTNRLSYAPRTLDNGATMKYQLTLLLTTFIISANCIAGGDAGDDSYDKMTDQELTRLINDYDTKEKKAEAKSDAYAEVKEAILRSTNSIAQINYPDTLSSSIRDFEKQLDGKKAPS
jgi:hypothetical protein